MSKGKINVNVAPVYNGMTEPAAPAEHKAQSVTSGKKPVLNCRFPVDIYDYVDTLARGDGMTKTAVLMGIIREYRATHPDRLAIAKENIKKYGI